MKNHSRIVIVSQNITFFIEHNIENKEIVFREMKQDACQVPKIA